MVKSVLIVLKHLIYGGTEKYTLNLVNSLIDKNISVTLISGDGPLASHVSSKVNLHIMPISRKPRIREITEKRILEIAKACNPQIIHTQCRTSMVNSQLARTSLNLPLVTHEHHMYDSQDYPFIVDELRDGAEKIIAIGPYTKRKLVKNGIKKDGIISILNGVDVHNTFPISVKERATARKLLKIHKNDKVIICLSRLEQGKGIDKLAMGFIEVARQIPEAKLFIVGDDETNFIKPFLKELVEKNNLQNKLFILNGEYNIRKYHAVADVFCYPALGKGMAVMEAMAAALPVVGKRTFKKPFVVEHGISGFMTDETTFYKIDPGRMAENLINLLNNPKLSKKMGKAARERIEQKFNLDKTVENVIESYNEAIESYNLFSSKSMELSINNALLAYE
ncbi:MAG TPA: glycosyltransferase family 4 protein [Patescibacteria group bacterium]|nr:glycosyltransferase family 4 protein [Patescibacteria group bacterium]